MALGAAVSASQPSFPLVVLDVSTCTAVVPLRTETQGSFGYLYKCLSVLYISVQSSVISSKVMRGVAAVWSAYAVVVDRQTNISAFTWDPALIRWSVVPQ